MSGAKASVDVTYLSKAEATGKVVLRPECIATRIEIDSQGKAKSVIYFDKSGVEHKQEADVIVVSAGVIQSSRLLLNSKSNIFPDGLANSSGLVGKYFMQHFGISADAIFPDRIDSYRGFFGGATSYDFAKSSSDNSFARGWHIALHSGIRAPVEMALISRTWGTQLKDYMRNTFGHSAGIAIGGEQLPDERNCIGLDPVVRDDYGMPVPRINFKLRENDRLISKEMKKNLREIIDAAGATEVHYKYNKPGGEAHNYGGCRMGNDPKSSVLNSFCQSHDVPNLFVVDASCFVTTGAANPSLTIQAIAVRASEYIVVQSKKRNL
jgi:choline dehydrogenase-like flavoprotein